MGYPGRASVALEIESMGMWFLVAIRGGDVVELEGYGDFERASDRAKYANEIAELGTRYYLRFRLVRGEERVG